ncbi:hypothetical protein RJ641_015987 [Dillenia turbinata]|uniref:Uncharacterized protein n=1 Tax=Dillenia turbinata TaxID=194707 RepID=A0AAN8V290_9MAGN
MCISQQGNCCQNIKASKAAGDGKDPVTAQMIANMYASMRSEINQIYSKIMESEMEKKKEVAKFKAKYTIRIREADNDVKDEDGQKEGSLQGVPDGPAVYAWFVQRRVRPCYANAIEHVSSVQLLRAFAFL